MITFILSSIDDWVDFFGVFLAVWGLNSEPHTLEPHLQPQLGLIMTKSATVKLFLVSVGLGVGFRRGSFVCKIVGDRTWGLAPAR
jgi:hypothetical protein